MLREAKSLYKEHRKEQIETTRNLVIQPIADGAAMTRTGAPEPADTKPAIRTAELIGAFSLAADLAIGLPAGHALRACYLAAGMGRELGLSAQKQTELYYTPLLVDAGCTAWASYLAEATHGDEVPARQALLFETDFRSASSGLRWLLRYSAPGAALPERVRVMLQLLVHRHSFAREGFENAFEVARRLAQRLGMPPGVQKGLSGLAKHWEVTGPSVANRSDIPLVSRIAYMAVVLENAHRLGGRQAAEEAALEDADKLFTPGLVEAFRAASAAPDFWTAFEQDSIWSVVQELEPDSPYRYVPVDRLPAIAETFGDFVDLKTPHMAGHSRRVADLAVRIAHRLGFSPDQHSALRIAALAHDIGLVAVPSFTLGKPEVSLTAGELEAQRLHPYHGGRVLSRAPALREAARLVADHHEREDGQGYPHGLAGARIAIEARVIAVADRFDELTHGAPGRTEVNSEKAVLTMRREQPGPLWEMAVGALAEELQVTPHPAYVAHRRHCWPAGLTNREVEVLRVLSRGLSTRHIADRLHISESTVRHHLEHIYDKAGVTTRTAATLFAMEQGLLR